MFAAILGMPGQDALSQEWKHSFEVIGDFRGNSNSV
jgi:hypothetical protein